MTKEKTKSHSARRLAEILKILADYHILRGATPEKMRSVLEALGPTFVKFGQILSMRPDMIPQEYCTEFEKLRSDVIPLPFDQILETIESELHCSAMDVFESIDPVPLGSASIAQVHSAQLRDGSTVVIKVQRPGIRETMQADVRLISQNAGIIGKVSGLGDVLDLKAMIQELWKTSQIEMDFLNEAKNMDLFRKNSAGIRYITSPRVFHEYTTERILTMSRIFGPQIDDLNTLSDMGYDIHEISRKAAENYCKQVLDDGFFQADPHPGNLLISGGKIAWIDWGMTGTLSPHLRSTLFSALRAIWENDIYSLENAFLMIGRPKKPVNQAQLINQMNALVQEYRSQELGNFDMESLMQKMMDLIRENEIEIPAELTLLSRSIITMEGTLSKIDPSVNLMDIFSTHMKVALLNNFDLEDGLKKHGYDIYKSIKKSLTIPSEAADILHQTNSGKLIFSVIEHPSPDQLRASQDNVNRIICSVLVFAFYLCGVLLCLTDIHPCFSGIPWIAWIFWFLGSLTLTVLILSIIRRKK